MILRIKKKKKNKTSKIIRVIIVAWNVTEIKIILIRFANILALIIYVDLMTDIYISLEKKLSFCKSLDYHFIIYYFNYAVMFFKLIFVFGYFYRKKKNYRYDYSLSFDYVYFFRINVILFIYFYLYFFSLIFEFYWIL